MRHLQTVGFIATATLLGILSIVSLPASSQTSAPKAGSARPTPRTPDGKPDFSGVWNGKGEFLNQGFPTGLPYTLEGQAAYRYNLTGAIDPQSLCVLIGVPRADIDIEAFQILQKSDRLAFIYERNTAWRVIPVDGRQHPEHPEPSFFGDAVGRWDGDLLVVDVVCPQRREKSGATMSVIRTVMPPTLLSAGRAPMRITCGSTSLLMTQSTIHKRSRSQG